MHDAIIVLGYSNDTDHPVVQARVKHAVKLYQDGLAGQIIMSGNCSDTLDIRPKVSEAAAMADYAIDLGLPPSVILLEEESVDTIGNFYHTRRAFLEPCSWYHVGFVSTPWHTFRSEYLAEQVLGPEFTVTGYASDQPEGWDQAKIDESEAYNRRLLEDARAQLGKVSPGDLAAIEPLLGTPPRG